MSQEVLQLDEDTDDKRPKYYMDSEDHAIRQMMGRNGFVRSSKLSKADYILFTGGPDILPLLYGEGKLPTTYVSFDRDIKDISLLRRWRGSKYQSLLGICRGAQFLNVMVGNGTLWQDVNNHAGGYHDAISTEDGSLIRVSSTHHQMMLPSKDGKVLLKAHEATKFCADTWDLDFDDPKEMDNAECVFYVDHNALCYQPHPEFNTPDNRACTEWFFDQIQDKLMNGTHEKAMNAFREDLKNKLSKKRGN